MSRPSWRVGAILRESVRNVVALRGRLILLVAVAALLGASAPALCVVETAQFLRQLDELDARGRNVVILEASRHERPTSISRDSCERLSRSPDVERAGFLRPRGTVSSTRLGKEIPVFETSATLMPEATGSTALIGADLPRSARAATRLRLGTGAVDVRTALPQPDGIPTNLAVVVSLPASVARGDSCTVILDRFADAQSAIPSLEAQLSVEGNPISGGAQLVEQVDSVSAFRDRPTRFLPLAAGLLGGLAAGLVNSARGGQLAAYRLSGTGRRSLVAILLGEQILLGSAMAAVAGTAAIVLSPLLLSPSGVAALGIAGGAMWVVTAVALSLRSALTNVATLTKQR